MCRVLRWNKKGNKDSSPLSFKRKMAAPMVTMAMGGAEARMVVSCDVLAVSKKKASMLARPAWSRRWRRRVDGLG